jgi:hypothetical protein
MTQTEALRLALEAFDSMIGRKPERVEQAITAIKAALEAKDEPWEKFCDSNCVWTDHHPDCKLTKDEPVAWMYESVWGNDFVTRGAAPSYAKNIRPLYASQPQRTWAGLTDDDKEFIAKRASVYDWHDYEVIEATEDKLRSKNHD